MKLQPYNPEATCPKCGCDSINTCYIGPDHVDIATGEPCKSEYLHRSCRCCAFSWQEATFGGRKSRKTRRARKERKARKTRRTRKARKAKSEETQKA